VQSDGDAKIVFQLGAQLAKTTRGLERKIQHLRNLIQSLARALAPTTRRTSSRGLKVGLSPKAK
jgi:hypothetical protein